MQIKKMLAMAVAVAVASTLTLTGCGDDKASGDSGSKTLIRVSHAQIDSHPDHIGLVAFKNEIEKKLGNKYEVQIFPNASLGANEKVLELIKQGSVQFLVVSTANVESFDKKYAVFSVPYLFTSENTFEKFISDPKILKELGADSAKNGFVPVAAFTAGTRNFYSKTPIRSVEDLAGKKFRVQAGPTNVAMMNAFGAAATPMSFGEVYSALQQGVIDGAENNELALTDQKHGEVCKYFTYDGHQMCPDLLVGSYAFLSKLSPEDAKVFEEAAQIAQKTEFEAWHKSVDDAIAKATKMGVEFIKDVDTNQFREKVLPLHQELLKANPAMQSLYDEASAFNNAN